MFSKCGGNGEGRRVVKPLSVGRKKLFKRGKVKSHKMGNNKLPSIPSVRGKNSGVTCLSISDWLQQRQLEATAVQTVDCTDVHSVISDNG